MEMNMPKASANVNASFALTGEEKSRNELQRVPEIIALYVTPVIVVFGIFGNVLNILILTRRSSKSLSTMVLLCALSVMDLLVLVVQLPFIVMSHVEGLHDTIFLVNAYFVCYVRYPVSNIGLSAIAWLSAAVSIDRFVAIIHIEVVKRKVKTHARVTALAIIICAVVFNAPKFFHYSIDTAGLQKGTASNLIHRRYCEETRLIKNNLYSTVANYSAGLLNTVLPTLIMIIFGAIIIYKLLHLKRLRSATVHGPSTYSLNAEGISGTIVVGKTSPVLNAKSLRTDGCETSLNVGDGSYKANRATNRERGINLATKMVIATICLFITSGSLSLYFTIAEAISGQHAHQGPVTICLKHISNLLTITNASCNFSLYCCTCAQYRLALVKLFKKQSNGKSTTWIAMQRHPTEV